MLDGVKNLGGEPLGDVFPAFDVSAFGAYDVRGVIGENLTAALYYRAARAAATILFCCHARGRARNRDRSPPRRFRQPQLGH